jgi:hypothetical protein
MSAPRGEGIMAEPNSSNPVDRPGPRPALKDLAVKPAGANDVRGGGSAILFQQCSSGKHFPG